MNQQVPTEANATRNPHGSFGRAVEYALQPILIVGVLGIWSIYGDLPGAYVLAIFVVQVVLGVLEHWIPARQDWRQNAREKLVNIGIVLVSGFSIIVIGDWYAEVLAGPLADLRATLGLDIWPHQWPVLAQILLVFFAAEGIWYWVHRAEHRWPVVWRLSGHGAHHSFKRLGAINFGANHPLETFLLVLPALLVELLFGVGVAAAGAAALTVIQASIAHANIRLNTRGIGLFFTTNVQHIRHHSAVLEESNTNYGCATIVWDRLFGTFSEGPVVEAGIGPTEPTLWEKFLMPVREPGDSAVAPGLVKSDPSAG